MSRFVKICPRCGSTNISSYVGRYHIPGIEEQKDNCKKCGYEGFVPEVEESKVKEFKRTISSK